MQNGYAQKLTEGELNQRTRDIVVNLLRLTPGAKVGLPAMDVGGSRWMELLTHMLEEINQRRGDVGLSKEMFELDPIPDFSSELAKKAASALLQKGLAPSQAYIKYGKREYMARLHSEGAIRLQPASYFSHAFHNGAVRDDELGVPLCISLTREDMHRITHNPEILPKDAKHFRADVELRFETDYWLYCVTKSVESRLFVDFNADSCVIIRDTTAFRDRLRDAAATALCDASFHDGAAVYVDPLLPDTGKLFVPLTKHFRYSYQEEHRFAWLPAKRQEELSPVDIKLGSLEGISDLVLL